MLETTRKNVYENTFFQLGFFSNWKCRVICGILKLANTLNKLEKQNVSSHILVYLRYSTVETLILSEEKMFHETKNVFTLFVKN